MFNYVDADDVFKYLSIAWKTGNYRAGFMSLQLGHNYLYETINLRLVLNYVVKG